MQRRHGIIFFLIIATASACAGHKDVEAAKHSLYDTDFAIVYDAALSATRTLYPNLDDSPGGGRVQTSWHQVTFANNEDDLANPQTLANANGMGGSASSSQGNIAAGMPTRLATKRYFIRFDVSVVGGRPWRVKVIGHASEWDPGAAMPVELHGIAKPPWLTPRTEALELAIYNKIKPYAIPMKETAKVEEELVPKTDPTAFKNLPPLAAKRVAAVKDALAGRDNAALRAQLAEDLVWSLGGSPGADTAMAMWQADPEPLDAMAKVIAAGCGVTADKQVSCPVEAPRPGAYVMTLAPRGAEWKVTSFVKTE